MPETTKNGIICQLSRISRGCSKQRSKQEMTVVNSNTSNLTFPFSSPEWQFPYNCTPFIRLSFCSNFLIVGSKNNSQSYFCEVLTISGRGAFD